MAINLSLSKMPWYGQVAAFAVARPRRGRRLLELVRARRAASDRGATCAAGALHAEIDRGTPPRSACREFRRELASLEAQMSRLRAVLPDERDVADLLRRVQGMATQSSLTILGFTPQAVDQEDHVRRVADRA